MILYFTAFYVIISYLKIYINTDKQDIGTIMFKRLKISPYIKMTALFGVEGALFQYIVSTNSFGNFLYATNLGANDTQIGLIQSVPQIVALFLLLPGGFIGNKFKSPKTLPMIILAFMSLMYVCYGSVPYMGDHKMAMLFVFLGGTAGMVALYNSAWQIFFAESVDVMERNGVFTFRNGATFVIGIFIPLVIGGFLNSMTSLNDKIGILQIFYYSCAVLSLLTAVIIRKIPAALRTPDFFISENKLRLSDLGSVLTELFHNKLFVTVIGTVMFLHISWQIDWSMWYIGEVKYIGYSEAQLSYRNAIQFLVQLAAIGFLGRLNRKKSIYFTMIIGCAGLAVYPLAMITATFIPQPWAPWALIVMYNLCSIPATALTLCVIQVVLDVIPKKNQGIILSLYTMAVTLSNAIMPLFGVELYKFFGANLRGLILFCVVTFILRIFRWLCLFCGTETIS
jgi:MFS family permease